MRSALFAFSQRIFLLCVVLWLLPSAFTFAFAQDTLQSRIQPFVDRHELAGAVMLVGDTNGIRHSEVIGFADISANRRMSSETIFWIASQSKPMTAAAVLMLVEEGRISLDDAVEKFLPEFRSQMVVAEKDDQHVLLRRPAQPVTIRQLLNHTSGMPFRSEVELPTLDALPLATAVRSYAMTPLQTEPGTHYQYSNAGINTAARVLEVVSGMAYEEFMQKRLFDPLGMTNTTFWPTEEQVSRIALSYRPTADKNNLEPFPISQLTYPLSGRSNRFPMPAGGLFSTAGDTMKFCQMILNKGEFAGTRILSEAAISELTKRQTPDSVKESYGLGFSVNADSFGHGGAHATNMEIRPKDGLILIWMVQHAGFPGNGAKAQGVFRDWAIQHTPE